MSEKIAIFIPTMEAGGAERVAISLTKGFLDYGIKADLVLVSAKGPLMNHLPVGVTVVNLKKGRTICAVFKLGAYLKKEKPTALISLMNHANIVAITAGVISRFKGHIMATEHNSIQFDLMGKGGLKNRLMLLLMRYVYKYADSVVAVSKGIVEELQTSLALKNVVCIYNPVDQPQLVDGNIKNTPPRATASGSCKTIVAIGRLSPQKNYNLLIKSFNLIRDSGHARLHILGEGIERPELEKMIEDLSLHGLVTLHGYVTAPFDWLCKADLFVLSSSWEGLPLVIIEALASGVTVVATDCHSGPAELLENGKYGYLVPVDDAEKMAKAILYALKNPLEPELLKKRAEDFSIPRITEQYLNVIFPGEKNEWD